MPDQVPSTALIELKNLSKSFRTGTETVHALKNINLTIKKGELLAIVGPSGSGKTTLAHIIGGLTKPNDGEILVKQEKLSIKNDKKTSLFRNRTVGFVFQNFSLIPHYSAIENVAIPLVVAGVKPKRRRELAQKYLTLVGLEKLTKRRANQLSGGQRQRVAIARALVMRPELIIADEPTGNLDTTKSAEIMSVLRYLSQKQGITVLIVTHDPRIAQAATRVVTITDGQITGDAHANK